ncbi:MAG: type II toxin-antitoxin system VapB family antitoxin [Actinomycetota bacterium]|nr:type II toxin-antitoxin system VapB family antitoxin [Actinomycetota bacterium]
MGRTNVVVDDELVERAMRLYNLPTKRAAIDFALRRLVGGFEPKDILELEGMGWEGNLDEMRQWEPPKW